MFPTSPPAPTTRPTYSALKGSARSKSTLLATKSQSAAATANGTDKGRASLSHSHASSISSNPRSGATCQLQVVYLTVYCDVIVNGSDERRVRERNGSWTGHSSDLYEFVGLNPQQHGRRDTRQTQVEQPRYSFLAPILSSAL